MNLLLSAAVALVLHAPVDCTLGKDCFIQNYVDQDSGKGWRDFACGHLSYDGHKGTDFRLKNLKQMQAGVNVLAAADGTVKAVRDGVADVSIRSTDANPDAIKNRECGNGVLLTHEGGYTTQYCHLKRGSLKVAEGQSVKAGDVLGQIGLSGQTEFPHVHVQVADSEQKIIDPFVPDAPLGSCEAVRTPRALWHEASGIAYQPTGLMQMGFASAAPTADAARSGALEGAKIDRKSPAMIFWAELFGLQKDDVLNLIITAPDGSNVVTHQQAIEGNKAVYFQFAGRKRKGDWIQGEYKAEVSVTRANKNVIAESMVYLVQ